MTSEIGTWRDRFTSPFVQFPSWSASRPERLYFIGNESGITQAWCHDMTNDTRKQLTDQRVGVEEFVVTPDGDGIVWWCDDTGNENGIWVVTSFDKGKTKPLIPGLPSGWSQGVALGGSTVAVALADDTTYRLYVSIDGEQPRLLRESAAPFGLGREWETTEGGLSSDGSLICYRHSDSGDILHFGLRVVAARNGHVVADLLDPGFTLKVASWSPIEGEQQLAVIHELDGVERPAVWNLTTDTRRNYSLDLPGPIEVAAWWPDGGSLLLLHHIEGRSQLYRLQLDNGDLSLVHDPSGWVSGAAVRPDGAVWLRDERPDRPARIRTIDDDIVLGPAGPPAQPGAPHRSIVFAGTTGEATHMLLTLPEGQAPYPVLMMVHGGPEWAYPDELDPWEQILVSHGLAVAKVNYRGSTGSTVAFRTALHQGNIGFPEVSDVMAGLQYLIDDGIADPARVAIEGWSWGGYIAVLAIGLHPSTFAAAIGGIPVCDSVLTHDDCSPPQRAYDLAIMGGSPGELPELYAERSPITYVDRVRTPLLLIAGEYDSACPIRQVRHFASELQRRSQEVVLHVYDAGHHANSVAEKIRSAEMELAFLQRHLNLDAAPS